jgi:uncharacterized protein (TIGR00303 family)
MIRTHAGEATAWLRHYSGKKPLYACILSFTETGLIPGISGAGFTPMARQYTALADGELLLSGTSQYPMPPLEAGISPAAISRALLLRQAIPIQLLSTGLPDALGVPHVALPQVRARSVDSGRAMSLEQVRQLFQSGWHWGERLAHQCPDGYLIIGECVVGGTTTAQALLMALGYGVAGQMSSSHLHSNHAQKLALVNKGLAVWRRQRRSIGSAIAAVGDPMQPVAAGMALSASRRVGVLLAGGSQMLAVYALVDLLAASATASKRDSKVASSFDCSDFDYSDLDCLDLDFLDSNGSAWAYRASAWRREQLVVGTTRWVVEDRSADTVAIARSLNAPYLASQLSFHESPAVHLRAYERGYVKEGLGAGGCAIAAHLYQGWTNTQMRHAVEAELRSCL